MPKSLKVEANYAKLEDAYAQTKSLGSAIWRIYKGSFCMMIVLAILFLIANNSVTVLMYLLLGIMAEDLKTTGNKFSDPYKYLPWVGAIIGSQMMYITLNTYCNSYIY